MGIKDLPKVLIYLSLFALVASVAAQFPRARGAPELASLERVQTPLLSVHQRPMTLIRNHKGAVVSRNEGAWDILVELEGAQRWLTLDHQPPERIQALRRLGGNTPLVVLHDGETAWQLEGPAGTLISFEQRAEYANLARRNQLAATAYLGLAGLALLGLGAWLSMRARAQRATTAAAEARARG